MVIEVIRARRAPAEPEAVKDVTPAP
jgi:hypothetical protein